MSVQDLKISIIQAATVWHDPKANRDYYQALLSEQNPESDLIVLPETFVIACVVSFVPTTIPTSFRISFAALPARQA